MQSTKLKITCIIHSLHLGGMERVMAILLNSFTQKENTEVSLLLIGKTPKIEFDILNNVKIYVPSFDFNPNKRTLSTFKTILFIRKSIKEINPDTILSFGEYWNNLVLLSLYGLKYPVYVSDRSQPNKNLGKVQNLMRNKLYPTASGYIAQTEKAAEIARKNQWNQNIAIIGNPITQVSEDKTVEKENIILTVGRLIPTKHIDELMEMFKTIDDKNWKLMVVGGNAKNMHLLEDYQQRIKKWNLEDRIHLVGAQTNVIAYYKKAKIFAFTSSSEGFPNVVGEAMAFGLPVIAYDCVAGPSDLIEDGKTGFLIEERNQERYIKNLKRLMSDATLRKTLGENGKEKTMAFDADKIANKFFNFITKQKMRLLINTATTFKGGGVQVAKSFIEECRRFPEHEYIVVLGLNLTAQIDKKDFPSNFTFFEIPYRPATRVFGFKDPAAFLKKIEKEQKPDVVFTTSGPAYWRPKVPHLMGYNLPHYIYAESPYFQKISAIQRFKWILKGSVIKYFVHRDADAYVVQTDDVNLRLKKWLQTSRAITTISNTYGQQYNEIEEKAKEMLPEQKENEFRFLMLSAYYEHKNLEILNDIIPLVQEDSHANIQFVTTLPNAIFAEIFTEKARKNIINVGPVKPDDCPQLYLETHAVFLPTLLECFSATYAEAMKMKLPIVTTNLGFAKTVCGRAALYYDPLSATDAYDKIRELIENKTLYADLLKHAEKEMVKFNSASQRAKKYIQLCENMLGVKTV